jgi:hypothetical protein
MKNNKSFIKGYVLGRCCSKFINLELLKHEIKSIKG